MTWRERWDVACLVFPVLVPWLVILVGLVLMVVMAVACISSRV